MNSYLERAQELKHDFIAIRRHLHQIPELAMDLPETSAYVISELEKLGINAHRVSESVIVALIGGKKGGPVFLIRADMDALNMREQSGLDFVSQRHNAHTLWARPTYDLATRRCTPAKRAGRSTMRHRKADVSAR